MAETELIQILNEKGIFPQDWKSREDVDQAAVDEVEREVLSQLSAEDIAEHNNFAYSNSVKEYGQKDANRLVVPEIVDFINLMPEGGLVLDIGAGHLRDTVYMVDPESRLPLSRSDMATPYGDNRLKVVPLDISEKFFDGNLWKIAGPKKVSSVPLMVLGDFMKPGRGQIYHSLEQRFSSNLGDVFTRGDLRPVLDGIWSCAGYMVHMDPTKFEEATQGWAKTLKQGGVFAVSYINKKDNGHDMKLLASRSAPGEVKIFSHFRSQDVDRVFENAGMRLIDSSTGDYSGHGHVMKDFFGSAMYRKL